MSLLCKKQTNNSMADGNDSQAESKSDYTNCTHKEFSYNEKKVLSLLPSKQCVHY